MTKTITKLLLNGNTYQIKEYAGYEPGIYRKENERAISVSSDGEHWMTISDRNNHASQRYEGTVTVRTSGGFYQRGNNGFYYLYPNQDTSIITTTNTQVDPTGYGAGNFYSSQTWVVDHDSPYSSNNEDMWGFVTGTPEARRGPCGSWAHIPTKQEWLDLFGMATALGTNMRDYMYIPPLGVVHCNSWMPVLDPNILLYWTCEPVAGSADRAYSFQPYGGNVVTGPRSSAMPIRSFFNEPLIPDGTRTKLY